MSPKQDEPFELHPRLEADTFAIADWDLCRVLLMNDCRYPWLILVPRRNWVREIHELKTIDRTILMEEISQASAALQAAFGPDKMNVGALGNIVEQLHVHVIARSKSDPAWPGPVWGHGDAEAYAKGTENLIAERFLSAVTARQ